LVVGERLLKVTTFMDADVDVDEDEYGIMTLGWESAQMIANALDILCYFGDHTYFVYYGVKVIRSPRDFAASVVTCLQRRQP
jgi:hypothetical protein